MIGGISMEEAANNINSFMEYYNSGKWIKNSKSKYEELCEQMRALQNSLDPEDAHGKVGEQSRLAVCSKCIQEWLNEES